MVSDHAGGLDVETGFGTILARVTAVAPAGIRLSTREPSIVLSVPANASFELDARVELGEAINTFGVPVRAHGAHGQAMQGIVGAGGPLVSVTCGSGYLSVAALR
jgi:hypothetical protein